MTELKNARYVILKDFVYDLEDPHSRYLLHKDIWTRTDRFSAGYEDGDDYRGDYFGDTVNYPYNSEGTRVSSFEELEVKTPELAHERYLKECFEEGISGDLTLGDFKREYRNLELMIKIQNAISQKDAAAILDAYAELECGSGNPPYWSLDISNSNSEER